MVVEFKIRELLLHRRLFFKNSGDSCWLVVIGFLIAFVTSAGEQQPVL
jgi:hypothetical protein